MEQSNSNHVGQWDAVVQSSRQFLLPGNPPLTQRGTRTFPFLSQPYRRHLDPPNFPLPAHISDIPNPERLERSPHIRRATSRRALPSSNLTSQFPNTSAPPASDAIPPLEMPHRPSAHPVINSFIDLTEDPLPSLPRMSPLNHRKRPTFSVPDSRQSATSQLHPPKRRALEVPERGFSVGAKIEEADLTDVNDDNALLEVLEKQREQEREQQRSKAIKAQQDLAKQPVTFSSLKCIICMESMTDITVTHCGHVFCHGCLMEALIASERQGPEGKGQPKCPVCRKKVLRPRDKKPTTQLIPLEIKLGKRVAKGKSKEIS